MIKNRTMLGLLCIVLAIAVTFGVSPIVNRMASQKTEIIRATKDISQGQQITAENIETVEVGGYNLPDSVIKDKAAIIGKYAACDIMANDYLLPSKLLETADRAEDVLKNLDGTQQAISITIPNFAGGLSGKLRNGDIVSVIVTEDKQTSIPAALTYVKVVALTTSDGTDTAGQVTNDDKGEKSSLPATVTLLVNAEQAKLLAGYNANAKLHLALVYRGDAQTAAKFLSAQQEVLSKSGVVSDE